LHIHPSWLNLIRRRVPALLLCALILPVHLQARSLKRGHSGSKASPNAVGVSAKSHSRVKNVSRNKRGAWRHHGQQRIDEARAREIQAALIREKYLDGEPSGVWDQRSKDAMSRYQSDHGWQSKMLPDSRALIRMGLGPKPENLLNGTTLNKPPSAIGAATDSLAAVPPIGLSK
jgi:hypothetical protein